MTAARLWAITSYFNPMGYRRRLENYRVFRRELPLPLLTVELSFGGAFALEEGDADLLLQLRGGDVMWQKERLLNCALARLPAECRAVVWIDCDVIPGRADWPEQIHRALERAPVVQCFSRLHHLRRGVPAECRRDPEAALFWQPALASLLAQGRPMSACHPTRVRRVAGEASAGFCWAARRDLLARHGLYDACIVGGGDSAQVCAAVGDFEDVVRRHGMNERQQDYYLAWARPYFESVRGQIGYVECPLFHLWHGELSDRRPSQRHEELDRFHFDPATDLTVSQDGPWRWNSDKPQLHEYLRGYFAGRREDG